MESGHSRKLNTVGYTVDGHHSILVDYRRYFRHGIFTVSGWVCPLDSYSVGSTLRGRLCFKRGRLWVITQQWGVRYCDRP